MVEATMETDSEDTKYLNKMKRESALEKKLKEHDAQQPMQVWMCYDFLPQYYMLRAPPSINYSGH